MVALDTKDGRILRKGWTEESPLELATYLPGLEPLPLAGILSTNVGREGRLEGIDREAAGRVITLSPHPVWASGGVTTPRRAGVPGRGRRRRRGPGDGALHRDA